VISTHLPDGLLEEEETPAEANAAEEEDD